MATVFDVAKYVLNKKGRMTAWKLQKLCYYAQAWHYTWTGKPLFDEDFEAWSNGPVCPQLFHLHKGKYMITESDIPAGDMHMLNSDEADSVDVVVKDYGDLQPYEISEQTHCESPWRDARAGIPDMVPCSNIITKDSMGAYYGTL